MIMDRREPGVYVSIEDASYISETPFVGRSVFCVGLCPKGPHNRVVELTSKGEFNKLFGYPDFNKTSQSFYCMDKAMQYTNQGLFVRMVPDDATLANTFINESTSSTTTVGSSDEFVFTEDSKEVTVDSSVFGEFSVGDWIYADDGQDSNLEARQIVSVDDDAGVYMLDSNYTGSTESWGTKSTTAAKYVPLTKTSDSLSHETQYEEAIELPDETVYCFYANGAGSYYNKLKVQGVRNIELEKMYTDEGGNVKYPYLFMNIGVYEVDEYNNDVLLEGPWIVSLTKNNPEGAVIRELSSGQVLFIQEIINKNSDLVRCIAGPAADKMSLPASPSNNKISANFRKQVMMNMSVQAPVGTNYVPLNTTVELSNGVDGTTDGQPIYNEGGKLYQDKEIWGLCTQAYSGSIEGYDGSIGQLREVTYPWYTPDYIITGGFPASVQNAGRQLADYRQDCIHIGDSGYKKSVDADLTARLEEIPWNNWTSIAYPQYRTRTDEYTGQKMTITPVFHAIERHLVIDGNYFLGEPVAGIEKGAITEPIKLAYRANHTERGDLIERELNPTIYEPDGIYFLTQFTTWKRLSILKRAHAAKFTAFVRKSLPPLLKDILQRKATRFWINQAQMRTATFLSKFTDTPVENRNVLESYSVNVEFDDVASELNVYISMKPYRVIERINVFISVK